VEVTVARALRHQIRAHFATIGHPLAGDVLYGGEAVPGLTHHALHASRIAFADATLGFEVTSPLPVEMAALVPAAP
jgi:23S rRNA pseudouridine1911/1915/1917 synthase